MIPCGALWLELFGFGFRPCELNPALLISDVAYDLGLGRSG